MTITTRTMDIRGCMLSLNQYFLSGLITLVEYVVDVKPRMHCPYIFSSTPHPYFTINYFAKLFRTPISTNRILLLWGVLERPPWLRSGRFTIECTSYSCRERTSRFRSTLIHGTKIDQKINSTSVLQSAGCLLSKVKKCCCLRAAVQREARRCDLT